MDPTFEEELIIQLLVTNECRDDVVTALDTIADELYFIDQDGLRSFVPTWSTTIPDCPVTYEIGRIDELTGQERPLSLDELAVITFNPSDGQMSYSTSNYGLDGQTWTIRLYLRSTYSVTSQREGDYLFDIEFRDVCWETVLVAAEFQNPNYVFDLWQL